MRNHLPSSPSPCWFSAASAFCQNSVVAPAARPAAAPMENRNRGLQPFNPAKPAPATPDARSAAALALSSEPTFDEGTAQRIRDAALSYSDLAVRGGWPTIPADAKFALGVAGPQDDLLRARLIVSGDLAADLGERDLSTKFLAAGVKRFQARHGLAATGDDHAADPRRAQRSGTEADPAAGGIARACHQYGVRVRPALCGRQHSRGLC